MVETPAWKKYASVRLWGLSGIVIPILWLETKQYVKPQVMTGWWLGHPSEKYERQLG